MDDRISELSVRALIERLASDDPIPGGGSASALAGAMGAALVQMVVALTAGRPVAEGNEDALDELRLRAATLQSELLRLAELDAAAYASVVEARRLPRTTDLERLARQRQVEAATREATSVPLETARRADEVLTLAERLAPIGSRHAVSDVGVGAELAATAVRGAALNVAINLPYLAGDEALRTEAASETERLVAGLDPRVAAIRDTVAERIG